MPFEDMGIMRNIPTAIVIEPTDVCMLESVIDQMAGIYGVQYMRLLRKNAIKVYEKGSEFPIGKAVRLEYGSDVTIIASGFCVSESIKAVKQLKQEGISAGLLNIFTWKPIDIEAIVSAAMETGAIVTAENHNVINGLGSAVAEVLVAHIPVPVEMIGVKDRFGEVGPVEYLAEQFQLTEPYIVNAAKRAIARKRC
jgi:transketolase